MTFRIRRVTTTRAGGVSKAPFDTFNLGDHVGDEPKAVAANRTRLAEAIGHGSLFAGAGALLGLPALESTLLPGYRGFLLAALPVGAFFLLALLIAARQAWLARRKDAPSP